MLSEPVVKGLKSVVKDFVDSTRHRFPMRDAWRKLEDDGIWKHVVYQVCVVGSSASYERLVNSSAAQESLQYDSLIAVAVDEQAHVINKTLRDHGVPIPPPPDIFVRKLFLTAFPKGGLTFFLINCESTTDTGAVLDTSL